MSSLSDKLAERQAKKEDTKQKASLLGRELDNLLQAKKEREAVTQGKKADVNYVLYQTLYKFESDDAEDLPFDAGEILRWVHFGGREGKLRERVWKAREEEIRGRTCVCERKSGEGRERNDWRGF